jgi:hypothetical protein
MTQLNYDHRRVATAANSRRGRRFLASFVAVACCSLLAVTNGAEQVDSGWAIGVPTPLSKGSKTADIHQQMILRRVLEETQQPILRNPPPSAAEKHAIQHDSGIDLRFAVRPEGVDGWRAAGPTSAPHGASAAQPASPLSGAATSEANKDSDVERDCSGDSVTVADAPNTKSQSQEPIPTLADAYGKLSAAVDAANSTPLPARDESAEATEPNTAANGAKTSGTAWTDHAPEPVTGALSLGASSDAGSVDGEADDSAAVATDKPQSTAAVKAPVPAPAEATPPPPLTRQLMTLRTRVRSVLKGYYRKTLNSRDNDPWEAMHGMLAYGVQSRIRQGGPSGDPITSVGWLCYNKPCKGQTLLYVNPAGEVRAKYGVGLQGHLGQLLAMLAQCHVSADYPIHVGKNEFTIHDLIEAEKKTCYPKSELTFKLIALQHYIDLDDKWVNDQGVEWDMPRLVREELAQPIRGAACGGTHRLSGLSLTVNTRIRRGEPLDGEYGQAAEFIKKYQQYAFRLQNRDGSLSTSWFRGAGDDDDLDRRIKTTGHILEWLCYSLSDEELRDQQTIRAVSYLANIMYFNYDHDWEVGPRSHATHALLIYDQRVFQPFDDDGQIASYQPPSRVAKNSQQNAARR